MFGFFKKKAKPDFSELRELLFGDRPLSEWKPADGSSAAEPWCHFEAARVALERKDDGGAIAALRKVVDAPELECRQYLQGWHALRQLGVEPPADVAKRVLGVILEVGMQGGLDTLAAYADRSARYINHGGRMIVWEAADPKIEGLIANLLRAGQTVTLRIGPWLEPRRPPPAVDVVRLSMLTPSGLHFGEGPFAGMSTDPMGGPVVAAGTALMQALIERAKQQG